MTAVSTIQQQFLGLLRAGLWGTPTDTSLFRDGATDWPSIARLASQQTVLPLVVQGMDGMPAELLPETLLKRKMLLKVQKCEGANFGMEKFCASLFGTLASSGPDVLLAKGLGIAANYRNPAIRMTGDVDLLAVGDNYQIAKDAVLALSPAEVHEFEDRRHFSCKVGGMDIEVHGTIDTELNPHLNRRQSAWMDEVIGKDQRTLTVQGTAIPIPSLRFDAVYIFLHFWDHYMSTGLSIRHICDWARFFHTHGSEIDRAVLEADVRRLDVVKPWNVFARVAELYLGCPEGLIPAFPEGTGSRYDKAAARVMSALFITGNFGHNIVRKNADASAVAKKSESFAINFKTIGRSFPMFPSDTVRYFVHYLGASAHRMK